MDLTQLTQHSTQIATILAVLISLWRYVVNPIVKVGKRVHKTSEELTKSLPILLQLSREFSSKSGELTLSETIRGLQINAAINLKILKILSNKFNLAWFHASSSGEYLYISENLLNLMGLDFEQAKGHGWRNAICEKNRNIVITEWEKSISEKREFDSTFTYCKFSNHENTVLSKHLNFVKTLTKIQLVN
jgi:hypothetical protein